MIDKNKCIQCGTCVGICPTGAITFNADGFPVIDPKKCIHCGACEASCPTAAIDLNK